MTQILSRLNVYPNLPPASTVQPAVLQTYPPSQLSEPQGDLGSIHAHAHDPLHPTPGSSFSGSQLLSPPPSPHLSSSSRQPGRSSCRCPSHPHPWQPDPLLCPARLCVSCRVFPTPSPACSSSSAVPAVPGTCHALVVSRLLHFLFHPHLSLPSFSASSLTSFRSAQILSY